MKKILFMTALVISSCTAVKFQDPQPRQAPAVSEFPERMRGTYTSAEDDTLHVSANSFSYYNGKEINVTGTLITSGDVILKEFEKGLILNLKDDQGWDVIPLKVSRNKIRAGFAVLDPKTQPLILELEKSSKAQRINADDGKFSHYLLSPTQEDFKTLVRKKLFSEKTVFKRIR